MKYIVNNNQFSKSIYHFIDTILRKEGKIFFTSGDYNNVEETDDLIEFYIEKGTGDWEFRYFTPEWYTRIVNGEKRESEYTINKWLPFTPFVEFNEDSYFFKQMNGYFGKIWHPIFEEWFNDTYPYLPVKKFFY